MGYRATGCQTRSHNVASNEKPGMRRTLLDEGVIDPQVTLSAF